MSVYYNDNDPRAAAWLRELIRDGVIPEGDVDERSITDVTADDVRGYTQCHWFAGIGGGRKPSVLPGGHQIGLFGPEAPPANPSPARGRGKAQRTSGTSGPSFTGSSPSAARRSSSASRSYPQRLSDLSLRLLSLSRFKKAIMPELTSSLNDSLRAADSITGLGGSMEYEQTWRQLITPSGLRYWAHTASALHISGKGFTGWPTPNTPSGGPNPKSTETHTGGMDLEGAATLAGWNTPRATDGSKGGPNQAGGALPADAATLAGWASPKASDGSGGRTTKTEGGGNVHLDIQARLTSGPPPSGSPAPTEKRGGVLNPFFSAWLMGFPTAWTLAGLRAAIRLQRRKSRGA
jgi:hypothetical protein